MEKGIVIRDPDSGREASTEEDVADEVVDNPTNPNEGGTGDTQEQEEDDY
jgi:hypothetical protein